MSNNKRPWMFIDNQLHVDGISVTKIIEQLRNKLGHLSSPFFLYASSELKKNVEKYSVAMEKLLPRSELSYSLKANASPALLREIRHHGVARVTTVSANEIILALQTGVCGKDIIFNGNGKKQWEIELAIKEQCTINVDSVFDARRITMAAEALDFEVPVLLRVNPANTNMATEHPYLATSLMDSKFGVCSEDVDQVLDILASCNCVKLQGVHVHLGSTLKDIGVYESVAGICVDLLQKIRTKGWTTAGVINMGGGFSVTDNQLTDVLSGDECTSPDVTLLIECLAKVIPDDVKVILEPGRSIVATAGVLVTEVLGKKSAASKTFVIVDAAMTEIIRPALYSAMHPVSPVTLSQGSMKTVDVVGPVCESGDFLAKGVDLPTDLSEGDCLVVWTAGAYCSSMSSNYNMRPHVAEVLVREKDIFLIKSPQDSHSLMQGYCDSLLAADTNSNEVAGL